MKTTMSKDGCLRLNLSVTFRVGINDIIDALCIEDMQAGANCMECKSDIIDIVKDKLESYGHTLWAMAEDCPEDKRKILRALAFKFFPELVVPESKQKTS